MAGGTWYMLLAAGCNQSSIFLLGSGCQCHGQLLAAIHLFRWGLGAGMGSKFGLPTGPPAPVTPALVTFKERKTDRRKKACVPCSGSKIWDLKKGKKKKKGGRSLGAGLAR